ncbi:NAD(P)/FAD-dependent oxidoreductase [Nocardia pseudovaccinii]|uniref:NAD(P)/FAD-dependent oxidoreductase n=1 Tax=Nocardia pseudovaccinii TaxID=189540 RepID=UPI0007A5135A|nr:NAD(P)/FAD-dependent oxidoreductase [Nocardia pseudovaccinii]
MTGLPEDCEVDILLIGGGVAAAGAAEELRRQGFRGSIALATRESDPPYYRFYLTKDYLRGGIAPDDLAVHSPEWWLDNNVQLWLRAPVQAIDLQTGTARIGRRSVRWGKALLATGANVRLLDCPGAGLHGVHYLRTTWNADDLRKDLQIARDAVVIGGSFIAAETAASIAALGVRTSMVFPESAPLARSLGGAVGSIVADELSRLGVTIRGGSIVESLRGDERVRTVVLADGAELRADVVVVGVGARPEVTLAKRSGLPLGTTGGVRCDATLRTGHENVWAAGDVCEFDSIRHGRRVRIEHDRVAAAQGRHAARAMLGSDAPFDTCLYFWTTIGADLHIDVLALDAPGHEVTPLDLTAHRDLVLRQRKRFGRTGGPEPAAFRYGAGGETIGYASINGALSLRAVQRDLTSVPDASSEGSHLLLEEKS